MLEKLKKKWQVNNLNLFLIICTFAVGGSLCGYLGRGILNEFLIERNFIYWVSYLLIITLLWPLCVFIVSIPLGQVSFFKRYIAKIFNKLKKQ